MSNKKNDENYLPEFIRRSKVGFAIIAGYFSGLYCSGLNEQYQSGLFILGFAFGLLAVQGLFRLLKRGNRNEN
jgi:hypothetical protein